MINPRSDLTNSATGRNDVNPSAKERAAAAREHESALQEETEDCLRRITDIGVTRGLTSQQEYRLAGIVRDCEVWREVKAKNQPRDQWIRYDARYGPGQVRRLTQKLIKAKLALKGLMGYVEGLEGKNPILARLLRTSFLPHVERAGAALETSAQEAVREKRAAGQEPDQDLVAEATEEIYLPDAGTYGLAIGPEFRKLDTPDYAIMRLFPFFVGECQLRHNEADVRIAKIGER